MMSHNLMASGVRMPSCQAGTLSFVTSRVQIGQVFSWMRV